MQAGKSFFVKVITYDVSSAKNAASIYAEANTQPKPAWSTQTFLKPVQLNPKRVLKNTSDLKLGMPIQINQQTGEYHYQQKSGVILPKKGEFLIGEDQYSGYLRRVESVNTTAQDIVVKTSEAKLTDIVTQGRIQNKVKLFAPEKVYLPKQSKLKSFNLQSNTTVNSTNMQWKNRLLSVRQGSDVPDSSNLSTINKAGIQADSGCTISANAEQSINITATAEFSPEISTLMEWHTDGLSTVVMDAGEIIANGTLTLNLDAHYNFTGEASWGTAEAPCIKENITPSKTWISVYSAGPVPVYQEITLSFNAQAYATATASIDATAHANSTLKIDTGVRYNTINNTWEPVLNRSLNNTFTMSLDTEGKINGEVRIIPKIEIRFYKVVGAGFTIEPYVTTEILAQDSVYRLLELQTVDFDFALDCNLDVNLTFLTWDKQLYGPTDLCSYQRPLFNLPQMNLYYALRGDSSGIYDISMDSIDGTNNPFDNSSIRWSVIKPNGLEEPLSGNGRTISYDPTEPGTHTIFVSGYGKLGKWIPDEAARRYTGIALTGSSGGIPGKPVLSIETIDLTGNYQGNATIKEGYAISAIIRVTRSNNVGAMPFYLSFSGTAETTDYTGTGALFYTFVDGSNTLDIAISSTDDSQIEVDETIIVNLVANASYTLGQFNSDTITIEDNDSVTVSITTQDDIATEAGSNSASFSLQLDQAINQVTDIYIWLAGTASSVSDYNLQPSVNTSPAKFTIPANQTSLTISINTINDALAEGNETVVATVLSNAQHTPGNIQYKVGQSSSASLTIIDDDQALPQVSLVASVAHSTQDGDVGEFTISRTGSTEANLWLDYSLSGTAVLAVDYESKPFAGNQVLIPAGESSVSIPVIAINTGLLARKTVQMYLLNNLSYSIETQNSAKIIISKTANTMPIAVIAFLLNDTPPLAPSGASNLNDTGIIFCSEPGSGVISCPKNNYPGQDAEYGRDKTHYNDTDGHAGFNYTKLSASGQDLASSATQWSCVRDNVTKLIWEVKTNDGGVRDKNHIYTWYNTDSTINGGNPGTENGGTCFGRFHCDTEKYVTQVNLQNLCGHNQWRLPFRHELLTLRNLGNYNPTIDTVYFPNTLMDSDSLYWSYWSATSMPYSPDTADAVWFYSGVLSGAPKSYSKPVRLVYKKP